jgi:hypothetical protein
MVFRRRDDHGAARHDATPPDDFLWGHPPDPPYLNGIESKRRFEYEGRSLGPLPGVAAPLRHYFWLHLFNQTNCTILYFAIRADRIRSAALWTIADRLRYNLEPPTY